MFDSTIMTRRDVWAGGAYVLIGIVTAVASSSYELGSLRQMGPGFYPMALGLILGMLGVASIIRGVLVAGEETQPIARKPLIVIGLTPVVFGLLLGPLGLPIALFTTIMVGAFASQKFRLRLVPTLGLAGFVLGCVLVFVTFLKVQMPVLGWVFGG
ncbi:tripartite tricarboxylate transporter TctB family protein [Devosia sp. A369]